MANILITGGAGFIGSYICRELIEQGHTPIILDGFIRYVSPLKENNSVDFKERFNGISDKIILERGFAHNYELVERVIRRHKPEYVMHLAAMPLAKMDNLNASEAREGSIDSTSHILSIISKLREEGILTNFKRFLYTSSSMIYGDFKTDPVTEEHPTNPINLYGTTKLAGEVLTKGLSKLYNIDYTIIRPSAVYGPKDSNLRVSQIFVENAFLGKKIVVDGKDEKLDFSFVKDVAKGFVLALFSEGGKNQTFNLTGGQARTLLEYAEILKKEFPNLEIEIKERDKERPKRGTLDISKARKLLNFSPEYTLEKGIKEYIIYLKPFFKFRKRVGF